MQLSGAYNKLTTTSHAIVAEGATITTPASVMVTAQATNSDTINVQAASYHEGFVGLTGAGADVNSDVRALVDGTIIAGGGTTRAPQVINPYLSVSSPLFQNQFSRLNRIDLTNSRLVFNADPGYFNGEGIRYRSGNGGAIPGLIDGAIYHVITSQNGAGTEFYVQLATSAANAASGQNVVFGQYPTINGLPITKVDSTPNSTIQYDFNPGFVEGQTVGFDTAAAQFLGYDSAAGSWASDGFAIGQVITVGGASGNSGVFTIAGIDVTGTILTLSASDSLQNAVARGVAITASGAALTGNATLTFIAGTSSTGPTITRTGSLVGPLSGNYTVHIVNATPTSSALYAMQLKDTNGHLVQLDDSPYFTINAGANAGQIIRIQGFQHTSNEVVLNPVDLAGGLSLTNAEGLTYHSGLAINVPGLVDGTAYYAIVAAGEFSHIDPTNPPAVRLASSQNDAQAANPDQQAPTFTWTDNNGIPQTTTIQQVQTALPSRLLGDTQSFTIVASDPNTNIVTVSLDQGSSTNPLAVGAMLTYVGALGTSSTLQDRHIYSVASIVDASDPSAIQLTLQDVLRLPTYGKLTDQTGEQSFAILTSEDDAILTIQWLGTGTFTPLTEGETLSFAGASLPGYLLNGHSYLVHVVGQSNTGLVEVQLSANYASIQSGSLVTANDVSYAIVSSDPASGTLTINVPGGSTPMLSDVLTYQGASIANAGYLQSGQQYRITSLKTTGTAGEYFIQVVAAAYQTASSGRLQGSGVSFTITGSNASTGVVTVALDPQSQITQAFGNDLILRFQGVSGSTANTLQNGIQYSATFLDQSNASAITLQLTTLNQLAGYGTLTGSMGSYVIHESDADGIIWLSQVGSAQALVDNSTLTFSGVPGSGATDLQNGQTYSVLVVNQDDPQNMQVRLVQYVAPTYGTLRSGGSSFAISSFDKSSETLTLSPGSLATLVEGQSLTYAGAALDRTILLQNGSSYTVHIVDSSDPTAIVVQLLDVSGPIVSDISGDGIDPLTNAVVLYPTQTPIPNGTLLTYHEGTGGTAIGGLQNGVTYQAVVSPTNLNLVHLAQINGTPVQMTLDEGLTTNGYAYAITGSNAGTHLLTVEVPTGAPQLVNGQAVTYAAVLGATTDSLIDGIIYYVQIPDAAFPNQIQLLSAVNATVPMSLQGAVDLGETDLGYMSGSAHELSPLNSGAAIQITAYVSSTENLAVWSGIGSEAPLKKRISPNQFKSAYNPKRNSYSADSDSSVTHTLAFTGAFLVEEIHNSAIAEVGANAVLRATGDISVTSQLTENDHASITSTTTVAQNSKSAEERVQLGLALAVMVNSLTNTSQALIDGGARVDAGQSLSVTSDLLYPWMGQINNPNGFNLVSSDGTNTANDALKFFDGSLGF